MSTTSPIMGVWTAGCCFGRGFEQLVRKTESDMPLPFPIRTVVWQTASLALLTRIQQLFKPDWL